MRLPGAFLAGARRCGTTYLARCLGSHPDVFVPPGKEIHFFDRQWERGLGWYADQFAGVREDQVCIDATPTYMLHQSILARIKETTPEAKMVVSLRDPVDRAYSHYWLNRELGVEPLTFAEALNKEEERAEAGWDTFLRFSYMRSSQYLSQLRVLHDHFPKEQILVLILEEVRNDPVRALQEVYRYLGVDDDFVSPYLFQQVNVYSRIRSITLREVGRPLPTRIRNAIAKVNTTRESYPQINSADRSQLVSALAPEVEELQDWLSKDLGRWWLSSRM